MTTSSPIKLLTNFLFSCQLLTGHKLVSVHPSGLLKHTPLHFPETPRGQLPREKQAEAEMQSLISDFLHPVATERLGAGTSGQNDIKSHPFFGQVNWSLTWREIKKSSVLQKQGWDSPSFSLFWLSRAIQISPNFQTFKTSKYLGIDQLWIQ